MTNKIIYFPHDCSTRHDEKILNLLHKKKALGYGVFWGLVESLYSSKEKKLPLAFIPALAHQLYCDASDIEEVIRCFELFEYDDKNFWSNRIFDFFEKYTNKSAIGKKAADIRWGNFDYANEMQTHSDSTTNKIKENKIKEKKDIYLDCVKLTKDEHKKLIDKFGSQDTREKIVRLNDYVMSKGTKYKSHYHTILNWSRKDEPTKSTRKFLNE
jgi:hypothetical protein